MLNIEHEVYTLLQELDIPITWSTDIPQSYADITPDHGVGQWIISSNGVAQKTSSRKEWISKIEIRLQTFAHTPEKRSEWDQAIDLIFGQYFTRTGSGGPLNEKLSDGSIIYRSVLVYRALIKDDYQIV